MARRVLVRRRRRVRSDDDNPRGYIRYRGRLIASAPFFAAGRVVPRRRRKTRRHDGNPLWRTAKGRFVRRPTRGARKLRRIPGGGWRNPRGYVRVGRRWTPITRYARRRRGRIAGYRFPRGYRPVRRRRGLRRRFLGVFDNPARRRYARRRRYGDNPVRSGRRRRMIRLLDNPIDAIKAAIEQAFSMETLETVFHTSLGFGGTAGLSRLVYRRLVTALDTQVGRVVTTLGTGILASGIVGMLTGSPVLAARFLAGGLVATAWQGITELAVEYPTIKDFVPTLGEAPESAEFRRAIEQEVLKEIRGGGGGVEGVSTYLSPAGVQETYLSPAGVQAYLTPAEAERTSGVGAYMTEREAERAGAGVGGEFDSVSMPERF